jgi:hypothetical protein
MVKLKTNKTLTKEKMIKMLKPKLKGLNFKKPLKMRIIVLFRG